MTNLDCVFQNSPRRPEPFVFDKKCDHNPPAFRDPHFTDFLDEGLAAKVLQSGYLLMYFTESQKMERFTKDVSEDAGGGRLLQLKEHQRDAGIALADAKVRSINVVTSNKVATAGVGHDKIVRSEKIERIARATGQSAARSAAHNLMVWTITIVVLNFLGAIITAVK